MNRIRRAFISILLILICAQLACEAQVGPAIATASQSDTPAPASDWYTVYFTNPASPTANQYKGGPDEALAEAIGRAKASVDVAIYDLNLWSIRDALLDVHQRGVTVRMVMESDNMDAPEVDQLKEAGISILGDRREGYMHNKFVVIDRLEVWSGSVNYTTSDMYKNNNNLIRIRSSRLAEDYTAEFEEMFLDDLFGQDIRRKTPYSNVTVAGTPIEIYFSPDDGAADHIVSLVQNARQSIYFLAFSFTSDDISAAMQERAEAGITVAGVFEEAQAASNKGCEFDSLRDAGLDVRLDGNARNMHNKVIIIDEQIVITGSYNFTANAEKNNDENLIVVYNPQIAALYLNEFQQVYEAAQK